MPIDVPFEPLDFASDSEQLQGLMESNVPIQKSDAQLEEGDTLSPAEHSADQHLSARQIIFRILTGTVGFGLLGYQMFRFIARPNAVTALTFAGVVGLLTFASMWRLVVERRWWLVPGGLVYREVRAWRKEIGVRRITPDDSSLLLDWRSNTGLVLDRGKPCWFPCNAASASVVVAGWISWNDAQRNTNYGRLGVGDAIGQCCAHARSRPRT
jgi:hypothetical protein